MCFLCSGNNTMCVVVCHHNEVSGVLYRIRFKGSPARVYTSQLSLCRLFIQVFSFQSVLWCQFQFIAQPFNVHIVICWKPLLWINLRIHFYQFKYGVNKKSFLPGKFWSQIECPQKSKIRLKCEQRQTTDSPVADSFPSGVGRG